MQFELLEVEIMLKYPCRGLGLSSCRWRLDGVLWFNAVRSMFQPLVQSWLSDMIFSNENIFSPTVRTLSTNVTGS